MVDSRPIELRRTEVLTLVFDRLMNVQSSLEECETVRDFWHSDKRIETLWHELQQMRGDVARAVELIESLELPQRDDPTPTGGE